MLSPLENKMGAAPRSNAEVQDDRRRAMEGPEVNRAQVTADDAYEYARGLIYVGFMTPYAGATDPAGGLWLLCDGRTLSQETYAELYAVIGATYNTGGEANGTFRLPDMRGRVALGAGQGSGLTNRSRGGRVGAETHTLTDSQMPVHDHGAATASTAHNHGGAVGSITHDHGGYTNSVTHSHSGDSYPNLSYISGLAGGGSNSAFNNYSWGADSVDTTTIQHQIPDSTHNHSIPTEGHAHYVYESGGDASHNNMQPSLIVSHLIRVLP